MGRVFVVENDPSSRNALVRLLSAAGHNVRNFALMEDFLCSLEPGVCGCLILDADMPGTSDQDLLVELKAREAIISIIIISSKDDLASKRKSWNMKAEGFFRKPVDGTALIDAIEWALRSKKVNGNHSKLENN